MIGFRRLIAVLLVTALTSFLYAQVAAKIEGTVQDSSGASVPGAKVSATDVLTQQTTTVTTSDSGSYVFPQLQPGKYTISVEANGFRKAVVADLELTVSATIAQNFKLEVGSTGESIVVEANSVAVQTTESQISRAVTLSEIDTLPQLNRSPIALAIFQPGVQIDIRAGQDSSFSHINGMRQGSNNAKLDGIDINDSVAPRLGLSLTANNSDSVGEFRVVTEGGKAEYGRSAGGQVELITRTGTNQFHGGAFDFLRNTDLNANDWFNNQSGSAVPKYIRNIYGGSFGGPVIHNKFFIFGNFQGTRTRQEQIRNRIVPTADALKGIFTYVDAAGVTQKYNFAAADPRGIGPDPTVAKLFAKYPAPNNLDVGDKLNTAGYRFNNPVPALEDQFTIRGDYHVTSNNTAFMRWSWQRNSSYDNLNNADATFPGQPSGTQGGHRWGWAIGDDWNLKPTVVNEFRIGHQSATTAFDRVRPAGQPVILSNDLTDIIPSGFAQGRNSPVLDITDNITKVLSKHTIKAGFTYRHTLQYGYNQAGIYPNVSLTTANGNSVPTTIGPAGLTSAQRTNFENLYNEILGRISSVTQTYYSDLTTFQGAGTPRVRNYILQESGYYIQDDWKVSRKLTLNYGLRYELFNAPTEQNNQQGTFDQISQLAIGGPSISNLTVTKQNSWYGTDKNNWAPRFGFAYDVFGDGRTAIRGNFGIFYDRNVGATVSLADGNTPGFSSAVTVYPNLNGTDVRVNDGIPSTPQPSSPLLQLPPTRSYSAVVFNPNLRTGYIESYALTIQRELFRNAVLEVGYVGNRGVKLFFNEDINQPRVTPEFVSSFREMQAYVANPAAVPSANNLFVRLYGTAAAAATGLGASNFSQGRVGTIINTLDVSQQGSRYATAGIPQNYFRPYPQYNQLILGTNDGRSYYDSLQVSFRRSAGLFKFVGNYTFSKSMDNISAEGNGFTTPIDSYNLRLNRTLSDFDRPHSFNSSIIYTLPLGRNKRYGHDMPKLLDTLIGGWDIGSLFIIQSGQPFSVSAQRATTPVSGVSNTYANYSGTDRTIGSVQETGGGAFFFTPAQVAQFSYPDAFQIGNAGRNVFRNPMYWNIDSSLVKKFRVTESSAVSFRAEAYNLLNHPVFGLAAANLNINTPATFGQFSQTLGSQLGGTSARTMQMSLRYDF